MIKTLLHRLIWIPACAGILSACAHKADLKTPAQIEAAEKKAEAKAAKKKPAAPSEQQ